MAHRLDLHALLAAALGSNNVYFQPPPDDKMIYPCIVYERSDVSTRFADNVPYQHDKRYKVTVIDRDPDSLVPDVISQFRRCSFNRHYTADNLNHDVFDLYF
jgi:hypothetical protein